MEFRLGRTDPGHPLQLEFQGIHRFDCVLNKPFMNPVQEEVCEILSIRFILWIRCLLYRVLHKEHSILARVALQKPQTDGDSSRPAEADVLAIDQSIKTRYTSHYSVG